MKKILLTALAIGAFSIAQSQVIFLEDFDGIAGPTAGGAGTYNFPSGWSLANVDNSTPNASVSYVNAAWERREDFSFAVGDSAAFSTSWYSPAGPSNDWMTTPAIGPLPANVVLSWNAVTYDAAYPDGYEVRIMTVPPTGGTGVIGNLITASTVLFSTPAENTTWTNRTVSLSAYAGQTVYISFRNNSVDMFLLLIDDVKLEVSAPFDGRLVSLDTVPEYTMVPKSQVWNMPTLATISNVGTSALTNVSLRLNVYNGASTQIYTNTGVPAATLAPAATVQLSAGNYAIPAIPDVYTFEYVVTHATADSNPLNDTLYNSIIVTDSTYARDNGVVTGALGIGAGNGGHLGQEFTVNSVSALTSVSYYVNRGYTGRPTACALWSMVAGVPSAIIATTDTMLYPNDSARLITLGISGGPFVLTPGDYTITSMEFVADSTLSLAQTDNIFKLGTTWVNWPTTPAGGWANNEFFGVPGFNKPYVIRLNLNPDCSGVSASANSVNATCATCPDGSVTATTSGTVGSVIYSWAPSGGPSATATGLLPGTYTVTITDANGCSSTATATVSFSTTIDQNVVDANTTIFPNPGKDVFTINVPSAFGTTTNVSVINYLGEIVFSKSVTFGTKEINLSELASGSYTIRFTSSEYTVNKNLTIIK